MEPYQITTTPTTTMNGSDAVGNIQELGLFLPSPDIACLVDAELCALCGDLVTSSVKRESTTPILPVSENNLQETVLGGVEFAHHNTAASLLESADSSCQLCSLIVQEFKLLRDFPFQYVINMAQDKPDVAFSVRWKSQYGKAKSGELPFRLRLFSPTATSNQRYAHGKLLISKKGIAPVPDNYPSTLESLEFARKWVKSCSNHHPLCSTSRPVSTLPKRVLNISPRTGSIILLHESNGETAPYATLTYCWGHDVPLRTLTTNLTQHTSQGIPLSSFPQTMRDIIPLVQSLGLRYLWIDALCIVQDDPLDWKDQAAAMTGIYQGCTLNLAVADAPSCNSGVARTLHLNSIHLGTVSNSPADQVRLVCEPAWDRQYNPEISLLSTRGWVFQETLVSPSTLYITHSGLFWYCCKTIWRQGDRFSRIRDLGGGGIEHRTAKERWAINKRQWTSTVDREGRPGADPLWALYWWVTRLSERRLSFTRDKLPSLAGLVSKLAAATGARYVAGLWDEDLLLGLTWHVAKEVEPVRRHADRAPSWSWACIDGSVKWLWCITDVAKYPAYIVEGLEDLDFDIEEIDVDEVFPGSFGEVRGGRITGVGTLYKGKSFAGGAEEGMQLEGVFDVPFGAGNVTCFFDEEQSGIGDASDRQFYLLRIAEIFALGASGSKYPGPYVSFLILEKVEGVEEDVFRRVGYAHIDQRNGRLKRYRSVESGERKRIAIV